VQTGFRTPITDEIFRTYPDRPQCPSSLLYNVYWVSFAVVNRPGVESTTHLVAPRWRRSSFKPLPPFCVFCSCNWIASRFYAICEEIMRMQITEMGPGDPEYEAVDEVYLAQGRIQWLARQWNLVLQKR